MSSRALSWPSARRFCQNAQTEVRQRCLRAGASLHWWNSEPLMSVPPRWSHLPLIILAGLLIGWVFSYAIILANPRLFTGPEEQALRPRPTLTPR